MTKRPADDATLRQITAADPAKSTWLTANAGSGKTRVLTDRVARLLLEGTRPERVLCLTYTKAAATEMQNRLLKRLGEWAMLPDEALAKALAELGVSGVPDLASARRLFALAIETPGGLKVQTIHSFCAALLRRFPLEAGVPHGFAELDDRSASLLRDEILQEMAAENVPEIRDITAIHSGERLDTLLAQLSRGVLPDDAEAKLREASGLRAGLTERALLAEVFEGDEGAWIGSFIGALATGGKTDIDLARKLQSVNWNAPDMAGLATLEGALLFGSGAGNPFGPKIGKIPTRALREGTCAPFMDQFDELISRVTETRPQRIALDFVNRSAALFRFGRAFSRRYQQRKAAAGWLDFDDLITRAGALLSDAAMAQWVLFRLDGGIDHILVDEAQDTSPEQWRVIEHLTAEFTAGQSDRLRTLFVVGDPKQSIYSFQGADIAVFESRRDEFSSAFAAVERPMQRLDLKFSFRSSPAILSAVDATFADDAGKGLGQASHHRAFLGERPGRVDIWPEIAPADDPDETAWEDPVDQLAPDAAPTLLAEEIARQLKGMLDPVSGTSIMTRDGVRPLDAGDILILVQGRQTALFGEIIRASKAADLPVAGADRLKLAAELAVQDIRAMLNFLATPEDDLSLAALLRSPLIGLDEDALFRLAHGRKPREYLWARLRASDHQEARELLGDMIDNSQLRPFELISRLLGRHGGRERLLARLGPEAEDGIDELLTQALAYERTEVPSLTGFLVWLSADDVEVRRQPGSGAGLIRVMTVHGSKGLESPVVILPDTHKRRSYRPPELLRPKDGIPMLSGRSGERPDFAQAEVEEAARLDAEERKRLLYVAMTRAESWLIVASAGDVGAGDESWYSMIREGVARADLDKSTFEGGLGPVTRYSFGDWPQAAERKPVQDTVKQDAPWLWTYPPEQPRRSPQKTASALGGAKALPGPDGDDPHAAMLFGTRLHLLLENLPDLSRDEWTDRSRDLLAGGEGGLPDSVMLDRLIYEATAVLDAPDLAEVFAVPDGATVLSEVETVVNVGTFGPVRGIIDRLIVAPDRVVIIDYKSNATVPDIADKTPEGILRQMAVYRAAIAPLYPDRSVEVGVLWTSLRQLMWLPHALLDRALAALDPVPQAT
ncbi:double-strand break repair helicase AddA [Paracoccus albus]|uniref:double-strand break repair helicase AddA n=1 Tax=Paracoccus albus TaxID=3017784 RepID=UPI0022F0190D|nr:double-strand break repair helicase AddA [Paracoccus albus]WBU60042.1 double-strand break repair helicase AddA [Paracoccus albus]